ncbi:hypothetical protein CEXT_596231 [Caerostris extrusa]|uniref:Uncharacterized protein n=1 Tax=Caerostris extrusa TaxID=172846 RepID=A0AAV4U247_CAEEX|nr:hypothetical protein CEXT_596231 [Caerostris extrusa]
MNEIRSLSGKSLVGSLPALPHLVFCSPSNQDLPAVERSHIHRSAWEFKVSLQGMLWNVPFLSVCPVVWYCFCPLLFERIAESS